MLRWLTWRWLAWIGSVSYGLYVIHGAPSPWMNRNIVHAWSRAGVSLVVSLILAALSWYAFERPIMSLKSRWPMPRAVGETLIQD